jgi:uncharacterized protein YfeS
VTIRDTAWWQARGVYLSADDDSGLAAATSHPAFVAVAPASFYDGADDFAPFGNDDGHDVLGALEDWYMTGGADDDVPSFLVDTLTGNGYQVPADLWSSDTAVAQAWAADGDDTFVNATAQTAIGVSLGQFKIRGHMTSAVRRIGWQAVTLHRALITQASVRYPNWTHAAEASAGIDDVVKVLTSAPGPQRS